MSDVGQQLGLRSFWRAAVKRPYPEAVQEALELELGRLGLSASSAQESDGTLEPVLTEVVASAEPSPSDKPSQVPITVSLSLALALKDKSGRVLWRDEVSGAGHGAYSQVFGVFPRAGGVPNAAVNAALSDAMRQVGPLLERSGALGRL